MNTRDYKETACMGVKLKTIGICSFSTKHATFSTILTKSTKRQTTSYLIYLHTERTMTFSDGNLGSVYVAVLILLIGTFNLVLVNSSQKNVNYLALFVNVPYEGYSSNASSALNLISTFLLTGIEMNMALVCQHFIGNN